MKVKRLIILLGISLNLNCNQQELKTISLPDTSSPLITATPIQQKKSPEIMDFVVYSQVLTSVVYGTNERDLVDAFEYISGFDRLTLRKLTIIPENPNEIKSIPELREDLVNDFWEKNQSKTELRKYDVKIEHDVVKQTGSLDSFFRANKKKHPKLKAVIGMSRIGFSADGTQSLVYVEYFNPERLLLKKYCLINWKWEGNSLSTGTIKWL
jgi:hypothetical protein